MIARKPYLLGCGVHSCLGDGVNASLAALRKLPPPASVVERTVHNGTKNIAYKLLSKMSLNDPVRRIYWAIDNVVTQALEASALNDAQQKKMALFVGSSSFDISVTEHKYQQDMLLDTEPLPFRTSGFGNIAAYIRERFGLRGEDFSYSTACTASANALLAAGEMVRNGDIEHALVVGVELLNNITALGFDGLDLLSKSTMKPFDKGRDGVVLGEACSALVLGAEKPSDLSFFLAGGASVCDTYSISSANPDGSSIGLVINKALEGAGISAKKIQAIKVNGTASLANDDAEAAGLLSVFEQVPPLCALKPYIGHTLGASGLTELILFSQALSDGFLVATSGISSEDCGLGVTLNQQRTASSRGAYLLNYFGFGGNNCVIVIANDDGGLR